MVDTDEETKKFQKELNSGITALALLGILEHATKPMYGYEIAKLIGANSKETPIMKQGALYPVLRALEGDGFLESEVEPSVSGPPRRYYLITGTGRKTLAKWREVWVKTRELVDTVLQGGE